MCLKLIRNSKEFKMDDYPALPEDTKVNIHERKPDENLLAYTQRIRLSTIASLTTVSLPGDPKDIAAMNSLLDGIDRQEINKAKIELDSQNAAADQEAFNLIAALVNNVGNTNPYELANPVERTILHEGPVIEGVVLVAGELDSKPEQLNYDNFMKEYKRKNPKQKDED